MMVGGSSAAASTITLLHRISVLLKSRISFQVCGFFVASRFVMPSIESIPLGGTL
jgi:hypothetical protein